MSQKPAPNFYPPIEDKIPPEVQTHLRLVYDRLQNHATAVQNLQNQINALQAQITPKVT